MFVKSESGSVVWIMLKIMIIMKRKLERGTKNSVRQVDVYQIRDIVSS